MSKEPNDLDQPAMCASRADITDVATNDPIPVEGKPIEEQFYLVWPVAVAAHNAALAAERVHQAAAQTINEGLREQLAAERKEHERQRQSWYHTNSRQYEQLQQLRDQLQAKERELEAARQYWEDSQNVMAGRKRDLAAAQAAMKQCDYCSLKEHDTSCLDAVVAEATKPLVQALEWAADYLEGQDGDEYVAGKLRTALAKHREGK